MRHHETDNELQKKTKKRQQKGADAPQKANHPGGDLVQLQQMIGNQAVQRLLAEGRLNIGGNMVQAKLTVGAPDDVYEQEADDVANQVMTMPDTVQRAGEMEEEELMMKRVQREEMEEEELMMKPAEVQRAGEMEEEELMMKPAEVQRAGEMEEELMMKRVQREEMEEEELMMKRIQRNNDVEENVPEVASESESKIEGMKGSGQQMPDGAKRILRTTLRAGFQQCQHPHRCRSGYPQS